MGPRARCWTGWCVTDRRTLVVGVGNAYRQDDGLGWHAINALRAQLNRPLLGEWEDGLDSLGNHVDCVFVPQLTPELSEIVSQYGRLIVVDARVGGGPDIDVEHVDVHSRGGSRILSHQFSVQELISLVRILGGSIPETYVVSARGEEFDFGVGLSATLARSLPLLVNKVLELARGDSEVV